MIAAGRHSDRNLISMKNSGPAQVRKFTCNRSLVLFSIRVGMLVFIPEGLRKVAGAQASLRAQPPGFRFLAFSAPGGPPGYLLGISRPLKCNVVKRDPAKFSQFVEIREIRVSFPPLFTTFPHEIARDSAYS